MGPLGPFQHHSKSEVTASTRLPVCLPFPRGTCQHSAPAQVVIPGEGLRQWLPSSPSKEPGPLADPSPATMPPLLGPRNGTSCGLWPPAHTQVYWDRFTHGAGVSWFPEKGSIILQARDAP